jgi:hypothetical protein
VTEGTPNTDPTGAGQGSTGDAVESQPKSVEEVEAFWRNRFSSRDRAHNAETAALHAQIEALKTAPVKPPEGETPEAARIRELEGQLARTEAARQAEGLRAKYPLAASVLGETITTLPEEKIAALNAMAEGDINRAPAGSVIDPNNAGRRAATQASPAAKPLHEKTKEELLNDLRAAAPMIQAEARGGF